MNLAKPAAAVRSYLTERLSARDVEHEGADSIGWAQQLHDMRLADATAVRQQLRETAAADSTPARRQLAIAAAPYREVVDEHLGVLRIATREPARLLHALSAEAVRR